MPRGKWALGSWALEKALSERGGHSAKTPAWPGRGNGSSPGASFPPDLCGPGGPLISLFSLTPQENPDPGTMLPCSGAVISEWPLVWGPREREERAAKRGKNRPGGRAAVPLLPCQVPLRGGRGCSQLAFRRPERHQHRESQLPRDPSGRLRPESQDCSVPPGGRSASVSVRLVGCGWRWKCVSFPCDWLGTNGAGSPNWVGPGCGKSTYPWQAWREGVSCGASGLWAWPWEVPVRRQLGALGTETGCAVPAWAPRSSRLWLRAVSVVGGLAALAEVHHAQ